MGSWKKVVVSGSDANLKNLTVSQSISATSITGSLLGSAQSAEMVVINSDTAPTGSLSGSLWFNTDNLTLYVRYTDPSGSSYWLPTYNAGIPVTSSYSISSSLADLAETASYVVTALTASFVDTARTASFVDTALTASRVTGSSVIGIVSQAYTSSYVTPYEGAWTSYTPSWTAASTNPAINNGTIEGWYKVIGKTCFVRGNIAMGSTTTYGSGEWYVSMPLTASHADAILMTVTLLDNGSAWYNATMAGARAGFNYKAPIQYQHNSNGTANDVNSAQPFTWANTDRFIWNGSYEIL
jgi:hypothetical protein